MNQSDVSILRPWEIQLCPANATHSMFLKRGSFVLASPFGAGGTKGAPDDEDVDIETLPIDDTFSASLSAAAKQVKDKMRGETVDSGEQTVAERPLNWSSLQRGTTLTRDPISKALFNGYCVNESMSTVKLPFNNSWFYVPPNSAFLISDISRFMFKSTNERFDLVIADPPWPNLSAARSNAYETMDPYALFKIPLQNHLSHDAVVGVWITHKAKYRAFVIEKLFAAWGLEFVAEWCWIKTTIHGDLMFDPSLKNRKSYEVLLIGRRKASGLQPSLTDSIPKQLFFASVPSVHHSQKPFLDYLLAPYINKNAAKLELFARIVRGGWTSWGNECLKFNEAPFLEERVSRD